MSIFQSIIDVDILLLLYYYYYYYYYYYKLYSLFCMRMVIQGSDSVRKKIIIIMAYNWLADRQSSINDAAGKDKQNLEIDDRMTTADW